MTRLIATGAGLFALASVAYLAVHWASPCFDFSDAKLCWSQRVEASIRADDLSGALRQIARFSEDPRSAQVCHNLMHEVGRKAYADFKAGHLLPYSTDTDLCSFGFFHGFVEALTTENKDLREVTAFCTGGAERAGFRIPRDECFHGIGHGIVDQHYPQEWKNVPGILKRGLSLCSEVQETHSDYLRCASGVYNGIANAYWKGEYSLSVDAERPFAVCETIPAGEDRGNCISYFSRVFLAVPPGTLASALALARHYAGAYAARAVAGVAVMYPYRASSEEAYSACDTLSDKLRMTCHTAFAVGLIQRGGKESGPEEALAYCAKLSPADQSSCLDQVKAELSKRAP